jgi:predicted nucleotidyltransferase
MIDFDLRAFREEILRVAALHGGHDLRVFGSRAHGTARSGSDLDLLLRLEPQRSLLDLIAIKQDLEDLLGIDVDVVTEASVSPYIREQVLAKAIAL